MKRNIINCVLIVIIMVSVVLSMCGCGNTAEQNDKYNDKYLELLRAGDQALADGNFEDALSAYQQAIELSPAVPQAYHRMFDTYVRDERFDDALMFALDNYRNIRTKMTEQSDTVYQEEGSVYNGMTPREETALFFVNAMDLGVHRGAAIKNVYPQEEISEFVTYVCDAQDAINDNGLTASCEDIMDTGSKYSDIVTRMREAGVIVSADLDARSQEELLDLGLGDPTVETVESGKIGFADLITPEEAAAFEKELRALLEKDPDLIFLYFDIANLYIQAGDREQAELVYQEGQTALRDMLSRRGYITEATVPLFEAQFANLYYMGVIASAGLDENAVLTKTAEQYKEAIEEVNKAKDDLPLSDEEKQTIQGASDKYCGQLEECIEATGNEVSGSNANAPAGEYEINSGVEITVTARVFRNEQDFSSELPGVTDYQVSRGSRQWWYVDKSYTRQISMLTLGVIFDNTTAMTVDSPTEQRTVKIPITEAGLVFTPQESSLEDIPVNGTYQLTGNIEDIYNSWNDIDRENFEVVELSDKRCTYEIIDPFDDQFTVEFVNGPYYFFVSDMKLIEAD